jgi:hypothetical protein
MEQKQIEFYILAWMPVQHRQRRLSLQDLQERKVRPPAVVSTYAYVNPVVAIWPGWDLQVSIYQAYSFWPWL